MVEKAFLYPGPDNDCRITVTYPRRLHHNFDAFFQDHWEDLLRYYSIPTGCSLMILWETTHVQQWDRGLHLLEKSAMPTITPEPHHLPGEFLTDESQHDEPILVQVSCHML